MTQFEQENDFGRGGGEVDDETLERAWETAAGRRSTANLEDDSDADGGAEESPQPRAETAEPARGLDSGDADAA